MSEFANRLTRSTGQHSPFWSVICFPNRGLRSWIEITIKPLQGLPAHDDPIRRALEQGEKAWLHFWESNMLIPEDMRARLSSNDFQALIAQWAVRYDWRDELELSLDKFPFPCLLYVGDAESSYAGMNVCAQEMPNAELVVLPGRHHLDVWADSGRIVPHARRFLGTMENK